ncbi:hypothetical protein LIER_38827 [Lithospermum erythrorhizon]|uniref:Uncharacterized protein n=1 Tax=Lithospermum erythrorhizon TaxID=34254 RepID=A0AAV3Q7U4_LITER
MGGGGNLHPYSPSTRAPGANCGSAQLSRSSGQRHDCSDTSTRVHGGIATVGGCAFSKSGWTDSERDKYGIGGPSSFLTYD